MLPWTPSKSLNGSLVLLDAKLRSLLGHVPDIEHVIVTTRCELFTIQTTLQATYFSYMTGKDRDKWVLLTNIPVADGGIDRAGGENVSVPCKRAHSTQVSFQFSDRGALSTVPELDNVLISSDSQIVAGGRRPSNTSNSNILAEVI